ENRPRDADTDSLYVQAESDLRRRLVEIRMLFDTTAVIVQPRDAVDEEAVQQQPEQEAEDDGVAF
ncbi:MAG: hypothetical protein V3S56_02800, partial [Gemmatimonadota bacterium]